MTGIFKHHADVLEAIIESSYDGLWICDGEGKILKINKASEKINEVNAEDVVGRNVKELEQEGIFDKSVTLEVLKKKKRVSILQTLSNGKTLLVTGNPIFIDGKLEYVVINDRDITDLIRLKEELEESRKRSRKYYKKLQDALKRKGGEETRFIFCSKVMRSIHETVQNVAEVDVTVFLQGESGVGKTRLAKMIHALSVRSKAPFIHVNCGAIPENLLESELFGYVKGAFTGARNEGKPGLVEMADKGTLFLDEITELPLNLQVKLLHFLDSEVVKRVGDTKERKIDVRIIAASNRDISKYVKMKRFREDLYFRLNIVPIVIPPLRDRREDIPLLIAYFLERFNKKYGKEVTISSEAVDLLCRYSFPGNIRELSNILERLIVMSRKPQIEIGDLPDYVKENVFVPLETDPTAVPLKTTLKNAVSEYERSILKKALTVCRTQQEMAELLGVSQPTIARKLRQYMLESSWKNNGAQSS